jgi:hypothetical protein
LKSFGMRVPVGSNPTPSAEFQCSTVAGGVMAIIRAIIFSTTGVLLLR